MWTPDAVPQRRAWWEEALSDLPAAREQGGAAGWLGATQQTQVNYGGQVPGVGEGIKDTDLGVTGRILGE